MYRDGIMCCRDSSSAGAKKFFYNGSLQNVSRVLLHETDLNFN